MSHGPQVDAAVKIETLCEEPFGDMQFLCDGQLLESAQENLPASRGPSQLENRVAFGCSVKEPIERTELEQETDS